MQEKHVPRKARKGTRSCTECRRRKIACSWSSKHASKCRRCEERGSDCTPQVFASPSTTRRRSTTHDRVARLEKRITSLTTAVRSLGSEFESRDTTPRTSPVVIQDSQSGSDSDLDECQVSDVPIIEPPAYLNSLFNNDLICSDNYSSDTHSGRTGKTLDRLCGSARTILQSLIPSKNDVCVFADRAPGWLLLLESIFPLDSVSKFGIDILSQYDDMKLPDVDPNNLASWLLIVAFTIEHRPDEAASHTFTSRWHTATRFSDAVAEVVERTIIAQEGISGSIKGIRTTILLIRLYFARGNFLKGWLQLRRVLAFAELLGLHRSTDPHATMMWECLCSMEKVNSMMFAFPSTTRYRREKTEPRAPTSYISQLANITIGLEDITELSDPQLYKKVSELDGDLRRLVPATPERLGQHETRLAALVMQQLHSYICMRVHMTLGLRPPSPDTSHSRKACTEACLQVTQRYMTLSSLLSSGFPRRVFDLQAFTAVVILLLLGFSSSADASQTAKTVAEEVREAMQSISDQSSSDYARQAIRTIRALVELLDTNTDASISMRVPLLGKVLVRRAKPVEGSISLQFPASETPPCLPDPIWGSLSWSMKDPEQVFYDAIMGDCEFGGFDFT
ncbi:hypothetical protein G7Z17_g4677 [Cylindrodendrum hubeiense]|uniref:Zn(2)-C6 fungal-type domain-containing protein n=1 Tax=Cylindrodendrum hubeiense TaxID=595255 RepID=A0A9P5HDG1_9HYPO|nr:hypothetical protein G7Z17_g4677 [Cylindrodendrum hubeiense]